MTENPKPRLRTASRFRSSKVGFPIRKSADQSLFAAPHGLSQRTTSFIASQRQGIHRIPLRHLIALIIDGHPATEYRRQGTEKCGNDRASSVVRRRFSVVRYHRLERPVCFKHT